MDPSGRRQLRRHQSLHSDPNRLPKLEELRGRIIATRGRLKSCPSTTVLRLVVTRLAGWLRRPGQLEPIANKGSRLAFTPVAIVTATASATTK